MPSEDLDADMSKEQYDLEVERYMKELQVEALNRDAIERATVSQSQSDIWLAIRGSRLTASNFADICKRRDPGSKKLVERLVYPPPLDNIRAIKHGRDNESTAIRQLEAQENIKINQCGFFIDEHLHFLGATPDGIFDKGIIEIKCPLSAYQTHPDEGVKKGKIAFWKPDGRVNENNKWYYQIQGQLHITQKELCLFAVWTGEQYPLKTALIKRDDEFWKNKMETKLKDFFVKCFLPEKIDPRKLRRKEIRDVSFVEPKKTIKPKPKTPRKKKEKMETETPPIGPGLPSSRILSVSWDRTEHQASSSTTDSQQSRQVAHTPQSRSRPMQQKPKSKQVKVKKTVPKTKMS